MMSLKTAIQTLLRLTFEQLALLPGVPLTPLLEAYGGVPLQELHRLEAAVPDLVLDLREPIFERNVVLQGRGGSISYLSAESLIVPGAIPLHVSTRLLQVEEPIDTILQELRLPTFRKVIAYKRACLGEIADQKVAASFGTDGSADVLYRTSLLYVHQRPQCATMRITEMLPVAYMYEQQDASNCKPSWAATLS